MNEGDERKFLHDIASPLGTAIFVMDSLLDGIQSRAGGNKDDLDQACQVYEALEKIKKMLQDRREILIKRGVPSATTK